MVHARLLIPQDPEHNTKGIRKIGLAEPQASCEERILQPIVAQTSTNASTTTAPQGSSKIPPSMASTKKKGEFSTPCKKKARSNDNDSSEVTILTPTRRFISTGPASSIFNEIFWVKYLQGEIFMRIDFDGDVWDNSAHQVEFSDNGTVVTYKSRIPDMMLDENLNILMPDAAHSDWSRYMLSHGISQRVKELPSSEDGKHFEIRKSAKLPYPVQKKFFDKNYREMKEYRSIANAEGAAYVYFWLLPVGWSG